MRKSIFTFLACLVWPTVAFATQPPRDRAHFHVKVPAQVLPHNMPFLCPNSPDNVPPGENVTLTGKQDKGCIQVPSGSTLTLGAGLDLTITTIQVLPGGTLATDGIIPCSNPSVVKIRSALPTDPEQWGTGIVGVGNTVLKGETTATTARMTSELQAGATTVLLESTSGMRVGGELQLNESRFLAEGVVPEPPQFVTITALTSTSATFTPANKVLRRAARNWDFSIKEYPEVGYVTRCLTFRSADPNGTRGHAIFTGSGIFDVQYTTWRDLARTVNHLTDAGSQQAGRYSMHFHHKHDGGLFLGNVVRDGRKWGISVHQSSKVRVVNNIFTNHQGWCMGTEDGVNENDVVFEGNMTAGCTGDGNRGDARIGEWGTNPLSIGTAGVDVWIAGPGVSLIRNKSYASRVSSYKMWGQRDDGGMDLGKWDSNECWSGIICVQAWYIAGGVIENMKAYNVWHGLMNYPTWRMTYRGWVCRGDPDFQTKLPFGWSTCFNHGDYSTTATIVENADVQNMSVGARPAWAVAGGTAGEGMAPRVYIIRNSTFCNNGYGDVHYWLDQGSEPWTVKPQHVTVVENNSHCTQSATWVAMTGQLTQNATEAVPAMNVVNFNRTAGDNFSVYSNAHLPSGTSTRARVLDRVGGGTPPPPDTDQDGVPDSTDKCPNQPGPATNEGCPLPPADSDGDSVIDDLDKCPNTPAGEPADSGGCSISQRDSDNDGVKDNLDKCPGTPNGSQVDANGCPVIIPPTDSDGDGIIDVNDKCPTQPAPGTVDGCPVIPVDTDGDGVTDTNDKCPTIPGPASNGGCPVTQVTTVTQVPSGCVVILSGSPPDGTGGWTARIRNVSTGNNIGTADSVPPYMPEAKNLTQGQTYQLALRWTKSGQIAVLYPTVAVLVTCGK